MRLQREQYLEARHYEQSLEGQGDANGNIPKSVKTRMSEIQYHHQKNADK